MLRKLNYFIHSALLLDFQKNLTLLIAIAAIFSGLLSPVLSFDFAFATPEEEGGDSGGGVDNGNGGGNGEGGDNRGGDEPEPEPDPEPEPEPEPGFTGDPEPEPPIDPCEENPEAEGCGPEPPIDPCIGDPTAEGCEPPDSVTTPPRVPEPPDDDCLFDPALPKCAPIDGECPDGFLMNEDGQCFPDQPCPPGFGKVDEDESGACFPVEPPPPPPPASDGNATNGNGNIIIDITIVTEINNKIRQVKTTSTTCTSQESTISLGPSSIAAKGVRVLAAFDPCILSGGGAILNLPDSNNNLKLVAIDLEGDSAHKAVEVNLQKINAITSDQTFYTTDFDRTMTGLSPITNKVDTIQDINSLVLLNDSSESIRFVSDNSMAFNAILSSN